MSELKTLKDIKPYMDGIMIAEFDLAKESLREEAIKWIKEFKKREKKSKNNNEKQQIHGVIQFIEEFFNIKDE